MLYFLDVFQVPYHICCTSTYLPITDIILTILSCIKLLCWARTSSLRANLLFGRIISTIWYFIHRFVCLWAYFYNCDVLTQLKELQRLFWARLSRGFRSVSVGVGAHSPKMAKCEVRRRRWAGKKAWLASQRAASCQRCWMGLIPSLRTKLDNYFVQLNAGRCTRSAWPASWWQKHFHHHSFICSGDFPTRNNFSSGPNWSPPNCFNRTALVLIQMTHCFNSAGAQVSESQVLISR